MRWAKPEAAEIHPVTANALPTSVIVILSDGEAGVEGSVIPPKKRKRILRLRGLRPLCSE